MKIVVTGSTKGIGRAVVEYFLALGHEVHGIDILPSDLENENYTHYVADVTNQLLLPHIDNVEILVNNAGTYNTDEDIDTNLNGTILCTQSYGLQPKIKSIVNLASACAHTGSEFGKYCASKGGVISYSKWTARQIAKYGATCNSISFGGVLTDQNAPVIQNKDLWNKVMEVTPLKQWTSPDECAEWIYFLAVINKSCTAQDIIVDNGESCNQRFVWTN